MPAIDDQSNAIIRRDGAIGDRNLPDNATLAGSISLGHRNFVGFSSAVLQKGRIGNEALIGAQTLVYRDTQLSLYCGSPARKGSCAGPKDWCCRDRCSKERRWLPDCDVSTRHGRAVLGVLAGFCNMWMMDCR